MTQNARASATTLEGNLVAPSGARFAIVASRFNHFIVEHLVGGAFDALVRHGVEGSNVTIVHAPGAWELPVVAQRVAASKRFHAVIALGAVIRGSTPHFDYVAGEAAKGLAAASMSTGVPLAFGVLTTENIEQAIERAGTKAGNKGWDAALTAIEMVSLFRALGDAGL
jgi:6,7-dimethyl-8-ribityllumazine synthase